MRIVLPTISPLAMIMITLSPLLLLLTIFASTSFLPVASRRPDPSSHSQRILQTGRQDNISSSDNTPLCPAPSSECGYGLWNVYSCQCDCIKPFCRDGNGDCYVPGGSCDENPFKDCTNSVDCPWWIFGEDSERCYTGNKIPAGVWDLFASEQACCGKHKLCDTMKPTSEPTKQPIAAPKFEDLFEVIPVKFSVVSLPDVVEMKELKDEMLIILKRILINLAESDGMDDALKTTNVVEKPPLVDRKMRVLAKDLNVDYAVTVVRQNEDFRPIILDWIEDSYGEIIQRIQDYIDRKYFDTDMKLNMCTTDYGQIRMCGDVVEVAHLRVTPAQVVHQVFPIKATFKVNDEFSINKLAQQFIEIYQGILADVDGLNITTIEVADIVNLPGGYVDVLFEVHSQTLGEALGEDAVTQTIQGRLDDILGQIQSHSDAGIFDALNWCIDKDGIFIECEEEKVAELPNTIYQLPIWAIIVLAEAGLLLCCLIFYCIVTRICRRNEGKQDVKTEMHIYTENLYTEKKSSERSRRPHHTSLLSRDLRIYRRSYRQPRRDSHENETFQTRRSSRSSFEGQLTSYDGDADMEWSSLDSSEHYGDYFSGDYFSDYTDDEVEDSMVVHQNGDRRLVPEVNPDDYLDDEVEDSMGGNHNGDRKLVQEVNNLQLVLT